MDREQEEMQFLGLFGIYKEAYKVIVAWRKIFTQITLTLILPLSFIFLAHLQISQVLFSKIMKNEDQLDDTQPGTRSYNKLSDLVSSELTTFWLFKAAYLTFLLIFSLLSTSAVVYTIACIYTGRDVTFRNVMSVVPKVWKRLMATFLCIFVAFLCYNIIAFLLLIIWFLALALSGSFGIMILYFLGFFYIAGSVYMSIVWQLASVVSVLEESYGIKAMVKSNELIKGKMWVAIIIFFKLNFALAFIKEVFEKLVVYGESLGMANRVGYGVLCSLLLIIFFLFALVIQTVVYFVCKSYHHENIDKSALSDHLEVYLGEYVPLKAKGVQLEHFQV